jgi:hypothetical protein
LIDITRPKVVTFEKENSPKETQIINRLAEIDVKLYMGMTDSEITEHSIRKVMECIV